MNRLKLLAVLLLTCQLGLASACVTKELTTTETYYITDNKTAYKTESYTETETVVVKTTTGNMSIRPSSQWHNAIWWLEALGSSESTYYYGYNLLDDYRFDSNKHSRSQIKITLSPMAIREKGSVAVCDLTGIGQIPTMESVWWDDYYLYRYEKWLQELQAKLENAIILGQMETGTTETGAPKTGDSITFDAKGVNEFAIFVNSYMIGSITNVELSWWDDVTEQRTVTKTRQVPYQVSDQIARQRTVTKPIQVPFWEAILNK